MIQAKPSFAGPGGWLGRWWNKPQGPLFLLGAVLLFNLVETRLETAWGAPTKGGGAALLADMEGNLSFLGQDQVWSSAVASYCLFYFIVLPALLVFLPLALVWRRAHAELRAFALAVTINYAACLLFFLLLPVPERWVVVGSDAVLLPDRLSPELIRWFRPLSGLNNCFPSMHVSLAALLATFGHHYQWRFRHSLTLCLLGVASATFVLGIHWLPDILGGLAVGVGAAASGIVLERRRHGTAEPTASVRTAGVGGVFLAGDSAPPGLVVDRRGVHQMSGMAGGQSSGASALPFAPSATTPPFGLTSAPFAGTSAGYIFVSYSSKDIRQLDQLEAMLRRLGYQMWIAKNSIRGGTFYAGKINQALKHANVVLILLSEHSLMSRHVKREAQLAFEAQRNVLPVLLGYDSDSIQQAMPDDWSYLLALSQSLRYEEIIANELILRDSLSELQVFPVPVTEAPGA